MIISREELEQGINSKFWKFILDTIKEFQDDITKEQDDPGDNTNFGTFKRLAGAKEALFRVSCIPEIALEELQDRKKE